MPNTENENIMKRFNKIDKSERDDRSYMGLILSNQMKIILVSDPTAEKSAVSLDISVGNMSDPKNIQGLAHFCEHMLFLGTEKYPIENDFRKFLSEHGGDFNAITEAHYTQYYFTVMPEHLEDALDRFSQFFISPLFTNSAVEREINAVNSEYEDNFADDCWRLHQLDKYLADPEHPYSKFSIGNRYTLETTPKENGIDIRKELLRFHSKWYSSNLMCLGVISKESVEMLEKIVVSFFREVENKKVEKPVCTVHPFNDEHFRTITYAERIGNDRSFVIKFPCKDTTEFYKEAPCYYIAHLVGHEGSGSILSLLKSKGWCYTLQANNTDSQKGFDFFVIEVDLTDEGMKHTNEIVKFVFQYINLLKKNGPLKWVQDENSQIGELNFKFKEKERPLSYICDLVGSLQDKPFDDILTSEYLMTQWRPDVIEEVWSDFIPTKVRIIFGAKSFDKELDKTEPWFETKYTQEKISDEIIEEWVSCGLNEELRLPEKNEFIPNNFELYPSDEATVDPDIILDTDLFRVWFLQDTIYKLPKANLLFNFVSPLSFMDPSNCNLVAMLIALFTDVLTEYGYYAGLAGLDNDLSASEYGLTMTVYGYDDKIQVFFEKIIRKLLHLKIDPERFEVYKENHIRNLKCAHIIQPFQEASYQISHILSEHSWSIDQLLASIDCMTPKNLEKLIEDLFAKVHVECFIHGNITKPKALELVDILEKELRASYTIQPLLPEQLLLGREVKLENGCYYIYEKTNSIHKPSSIEVFYQCGLASTNLYVTIVLFSQIIEEPFFTVLRTQQQLGYNVSSDVRVSNGVLGVSFTIQSDNHPALLNTRIEDFLKELEIYLSELHEDVFVKHRDSIIADKMEKPKQLSEKTSMCWSEITIQEYNFNRADEQIECLRTLTKQDMIDFYKDYLRGDNRKKFAVHIISTIGGAEGIKHDNNYKTKFEENDNPEFIENIPDFKSCHETFPNVQPYKIITRKGKKF